MKVIKEKYTHATHDDEGSLLVIQKIASCLGIPSIQLDPNSAGGGVNIFSSFLTVFDKNLTTIKEHHIEMKNTLSKRRFRE